MHGNKWFELNMNWVKLPLERISNHTPYIYVDVITYP